MNVNLIVKLATNRPEWANFIAMDEDGEWYWHELEPYIPIGKSYWKSGGLCALVKFEWNTTTSKV